MPHSSSQQTHVFLEAKHPTECLIDRVGAPFYIIDFPLVQFLGFALKRIYSTK